MQIIKQKEVNISQLATELKNGKVIVYPTETCYGLGCDATNQKAVDRLFAIKQRQKDKTVLVLVSDLEMAKKYIDLSGKLLNIAQKYWPGPLTIVAPVVSKDVLPIGVINALDNTIAVRVTDNNFANSLCRELGVPLVSTSANIANLESPYDIATILHMYKNEDKKPDIIIDGGTLPRQSPSTIIRAQGDNIEVLRQGEMVVEL